jgi:hypothetical protein
LLGEYAPFSVIVNVIASVPEPGLNVPKLDGRLEVARVKLKFAVLDGTFITPYLPPDPDDPGGPGSPVGPL